MLGKGIRSFQELTKEQKACDNSHALSLFLSPDKNGRGTRPWHSHSV